MTLRVVPTTGFPATIEGMDAVYGARLSVQDDRFVPTLEGVGASVTGVTFTTNSSGATAAPYLIDAAWWGREAGEEWARDVQEQWDQIQITGGFGGSSGGSGGIVELNPLRGLSAEEQEQFARLSREEDHKRDNAAWKAHELLLRHMTPRQRDDYEWEERFRVTTRRGHRYVIGKAYCQNVVRVSRRGKPMRVYCLSVAGGVPLGDVLLAQKLMLDADERQFLKVARQWPLRFALGVGDLIKRKPAQFSIGNSGIWSPTVTADGGVSVGGNVVITEAA